MAAKAGSEERRDFLLALAQRVFQRLRRTILINNVHAAGAVDRDSAFGGGADNIDEGNLLGAADARGVPEVVVRIGVAKVRRAAGVLPERYGARNPRGLINERLRGSRVQASHQY